MMIGGSVVRGRESSFPKNIAKLRFIVTGRAGVHIDAWGSGFLTVTALG